MPLIGIVLNVVIAYGIATRRIMDVSEALRRATSYALLAVYMAILYLIVIHVSRWALATFMTDPSTIAHMLAAITVAFSLAPAYGHSQSLASKLFVNVEKIDVRKVRAIQKTLSRIGPLDDLTLRFGETVRNAAGTDRLFLLAARNGFYEQVYPETEPSSGLRIAANDALIGIVRSSASPVAEETLARMRPAPRVGAALDTLRTLGINMVVGVHAHSRMDQIMLLGRRISGKIYSAEEQDALQVVCNQFGVAFENAKLYTELQDGKIYNDILVDSLVSGVIAVNANGTVSVFNREAQRITGLQGEALVGQPMDDLPAPLSQVFRETLENKTEIMDRELTLLRHDRSSVPVRMSCSVFHSHSGAQIGAFGVFTDLTLLKKLEDQVRRSDRLSSIGTLAAGMAHEIKNPLVSISTFTQLFPERYDDEEFRNTFSRLIGKEVQRIDTIVSRLLNFARPAKPLLQALHLHPALDDLTDLLAQQVQRKRIQLIKRFQAENDLILGDADLLGQALVNFFMNAIESMNEGGTLTVSTAVTEPARDSSVGRIRLDIADTGCGIPAENVPKIFDPFFTNKSTGTGLGLAVSHSILDEHHAIVEVETEEGKGTTFHLFFDLLGEEESAT